MRAIFATLLSLGLVVAFAGPTAAASKTPPWRRLCCFGHWYCMPLCLWKQPNAWLRQQRNAWAYDHAGTTRWTAMPFPLGAGDGGRWRGWREPAGHA